MNFNLTKYANMQMCKYATNLTDVTKRGFGKGQGGRRKWKYSWKGRKKRKVYWLAFGKYAV